MEFHALSGMKDYVGGSAEALADLINRARDRFTAAGFREISTPVMEDARLFDRSLGSESDIVSKEMYTVEQAEDRIIALRPENTAGVVRSVIEQKLMSRHNQLKLFYAGPMFRHERPQSGRLRQFHQIGVEVFGRSDSYIDAEVIHVANEYLQQLNLPAITLKLNSLGTPESRSDYIELLQEEMSSYLDDLCDDCNHRYENAPLRMLDCKVSECKEVYRENAPEILDHLDEESHDHFQRVREYLEAFGIDYEIDPYLVRGLDYYTRTTFEFVTSDLGSQDAVLAGGRYDGLTEELGGDSCPAVGFAAGLERIMILRDDYDRSDVDTVSDCFVITFGNQSRQAVLSLVSKLRDQSYPGTQRRIRVELGEPDTSVKSQMRRADRFGAEVVLLLGDDELNEDRISVKRMDSGDQDQIPFSDLDETSQKIKELLNDVNVEKTT